MLPDHDTLCLFHILANKPKTLRNILERGNLQQVLASPDYSKRLTASLLRAVDRDLGWLEASDHHLIGWQDSDYPALLAATFDPPPILFAWGQRATLLRHSTLLAMVGSRKASGYGLEMAEAIASEVASQMTIVSGLALGIDAAAHEGALRADGTTIAVIGSGCDRIYPRRHWRLAERIAAKGLVLSEFPLGAPAYPGNFPRRNRVVTGLCQATLVVEAALQSGSLVSARLAVNQGREVFALPGSVLSQGARGCHQLLKEGATLIESADDLLLELGLSRHAVNASIRVKEDLSPLQALLLQQLGQGPATIDDLCEVAASEVDSLTVELMSLEILGLVSSIGGRYCLRANSMR